MNATALISTFFGVGRFTKAPGTLASAVALPFAWVIQLYAGPYVLIAFALVALGAGIWASSTYARQTGNPDPSECVIDEVVGQWIACALSPLSWLGYLIAFILFRLFDITKIWPVSWGEAQRGGLGIMLDDVIAGIMAGVIVAVFTNAGLI